MNRISLLIACLCAGWFLPGSALAQQPAGKLQFGPEQKLMLDAAAKVMKRDFQGAEKIYDRVIDMDNSNTEAYLQRGIARQEMGHAEDAASDGKIAVTLANAALKVNPHDPNLYYQRGMGFRLAKNYDQARQDITTGMQMGGAKNWQNDLKAIDFEQKEAAAR